jgi:asparagine synthase (glutamine-hydrolysing)
MVKVDRASMAVGLEAREPLLDHRIIELAWSLPLKMKVRDGAGKWILRHMLAQSLPQTLIGAEKRGFGFSVAAVLRTGLRDWVEESLPRDSEFFDQGAVHACWNQHLAGSDNSDVIWRVAMFTAWRRHDLGRA